MAAIGSLYLVLAADVEAVKEESDPNSVHHCRCSHHRFEHNHPQGSSVANYSSSDRDRGSQSSEDEYLTQSPESTNFPEMRQTDTGRSTISFHILEHASTIQVNPSNDATVTINRHTSLGGMVRQSSTTDSGSRRRVAKMLVSVGNTLGSKAQDLFDDSEFRRGRAVDWPEIPGESWRNEQLQITRAKYNPHRDADGNATPLPRSRSRASSYTGDVRGASPRPGLSLSRSHSPVRPPPCLPRQQRAGTLPEAPSFRRQTYSPPPLLPQSRGRQRARRDTLEVPPVSHHNPLHIHYPEVAMSGGRGSPPCLKSDGDGDNDHEPAHPDVQATAAPAISSP